MKGEFVLVVSVLLILSRLCSILYDAVLCSYWKAWTQFVRALQRTRKIVYGCYCLRQRIFKREDYVAPEHSAIIVEYFLRLASFVLINA